MVRVEHGMSEEGRCAAEHGLLDAALGHHVVLGHQAIYSVVAAEDGEEVLHVAEFDGLVQGDAQASVIE